MTNSNISSKIQLEIIQQHLEFFPGNTLLFSNDSEFSNSISSDNLQVLSNPDKTISDHVDNLLLTNSLEENISKENKKFDTIIIGNLFEQIKNPKSFLQHLDSVLNDNGAIVCSISNFSHINNIFNLLIGNIGNTFFNTTRFYDLNNFLIFLNQSNMHTTKLVRVKQEFSSESMNLDDTLIPSQLVEMYKKNPDHDVAQYVFIIGKGKSVSSETLDFSVQFPKNYLLPKLQEFFEKYNEFKLALTEKDKVIEGLENSIEDITGYSGDALTKKDKVIEGYEESIKDITDNAVPALAKKDKVIEGLENSLEEQKNYVGVALVKKDKVIEGLENSLEEQKNYTESALQKQKEYTESALDKKDKVIEGLENSIEEQKNYIENIEEQVRQLESKMGKLKFWKK